MGAGRPAAGAALDQVALATGMALVATALLGVLVLRHVRSEGSFLERAAEVARRFGAGLPGWAALPSVLAGVALIVALFGMYWDISLHVDQGRDPGPLANPAHPLILAGLYGVFAAGVLALVLARGARTGPSAVALGGGRHVPVGALLMSAAAAFALVGFPLDDVWHRLFGQDVTLWGPTHLMLIGGAGLSLVGQCVLLMEGVRAHRAARPGPGRGHGGHGVLRALSVLRGVSLMGGLLIGLSTFQAEFDFGIPQYRMVLQPLLIAVAAALALVAARTWVGPGAAVGAVLFFLGVRGAVSVFVGVTGETMPSLPLYLGEAACVEIAALVVRRERPLALGALAGVLVGTLGLATEWGWSQIAMPLPWTAALLPEGLVLAVLGGVAGGVLGGLLGAALRGALPRPRVARGVVVVALGAVALLLADGLWTVAGPPARARVSLTARRLQVSIVPPSVASGADWLTATSWQGGGLVVDRLVPVGRPGGGVFRSTRALPTTGDWKTLIRLHAGRSLRAVPVYLPADPAIPVAGVAAPPRVERAFADEGPLLQRERKRGVPGWLWGSASAVVLALALGFVAVLCWGLGRVARAHPRPAADRDRRPDRRPPARPRPAGALRELTPLS